MAISAIALRGTGSVSTGSNSSVTQTPGATIAVGAILLTFVSLRTTASVTDISDAVGNVWSFLGNYNNATNSNIHTYVFFCKVKNQLQSTTVITATFSAGNQLDACMASFEYSVGSGKTLAQTSEAAPIGNEVNNANGFGSVSFSSLTSKHRLYVRLMGKQANSTTGITASTNFTSWGLTIRSRNNASATIIRAEHRINTSTGETSNPTLAVSGNTASMFFALEEVDDITFLAVDVDDSLVTDEFLDIAIHLIPVVFDTVVSVDAIDIDKTLTIEAIDTSVVVEFINTTINPLVVEVTDSLTTDEFIDFRGGTYLEINNTLTVTEFIDFRGGTYLETVDSLTTDEFIDFRGGTYLFISEIIEAEEYVSINGIQIDTSDIIEEDIYVFEHVAVTMVVATETVEVLVEDDVTTTEFLAIHISLIPSIHDLVSSEELVSVIVNPITIIAFDINNVEDVVGDVDISLLPVITDTIFVDYHVELIIDPLHVLGIDTIVVEEIITIETSSSLIIDVNDAVIAVSGDEFVQVIINPIIVTAVGVAAIDEHVLIVVQPIVVFVLDTITVDEFIITANTIVVELEEIISVVDMATVRLLLFVEVEDSLTVQEDVITIINPAIIVSDVNTVDTFVNINLTLVIDAFDSLSTQENIEVVINPTIIAVDDSISIDSVVKIEIVILVEATDAVSAADVAIVETIIPVVVEDTISIVDDVGIVIQPLTVFVIGDIDTQDDVEIRIPREVEVFDELAIIDTVSVIKVMTVEDVIDDVFSVESVTVRRKVPGRSRGFAWL